jgi:hypothetical protein
VVNDDDDDRESAEKIETRLALAVRKARIDSELSTASLRPEGRFSFVCWPLVDASTVTNDFRK